VRLNPVPFWLAAITSPLEVISSPNYVEFTGLVVLNDLSTLVLPNSFDAIMMMSHYDSGLVIFCAIKIDWLVDELLWYLCPLELKQVKLT